MDAAYELDKIETSLLVLFIPSHDRDGQTIWQEPWVADALQILGESFGGATAFPKAHGVWRDDARGGVLVHDEPIVIQCYTNEDLLESMSGRLNEFLVKMGWQTLQGAIGCVIDREYFEIRFPLP